MRFNAGFTRAALGALMVASLAYTPAKAQEGGMFTALFDSLGWGTPKPEIDYRERAPLVVPPKRELVSPQERAASRNTQWPNDPDVERRKRELNEARLPVPTYQERPELPAREMQAGRKAGAGVGHTAQGILNDNHRDLMIIHPDVLRSTGIKKDEVLAVGEEPPRRYLTDPPTGYRRASESVKVQRDVEQLPDGADARAYQRAERDRNKN